MVATPPSTSPRSRQAPRRFQFTGSVTFTLSGELTGGGKAGEEDAAAAADELPPPAFMKTMGSRACRSAALLASSAARRTTSTISWQCLHFFAAARTRSPQKGQGFSGSGGGSGGAA